MSTSAIYFSHTTHMMSPTYFSHTCWGSFY